LGCIYAEAPGIQRKVKLFLGGEGRAGVRGDGPTGLTHIRGTAASDKEHRAGQHLRSCHRLAEFSRDCLLPRGRQARSDCPRDVDKETGRSMAAWFRRTG
jgi:hypothetical protein